MSSSLRNSQIDRRDLVFDGEEQITKSRVSRFATPILYASYSNGVLKLGYKNIRCKRSFSIFTRRESVSIRKRTSRGHDGTLHV